MRIGVGWGLIGLREYFPSGEEYGRYDRSAIYEQQAGAHLLFYDPSLIGTIRNDVVGAAFNWVKSSDLSARDEYNAEVFYRFPLFPLVDTIFSYQAVIDPALNPNIDYASVFSMRLRTTF